MPMATIQIDVWYILVPVIPAQVFYKCLVGDKFVANIIILSVEL